MNKMTVAAALVALAVGTAAEKNWGLSPVVLAAEVPKTVDGRVTRESCPRFDSYCWYTRLAPLWVFDGEEGEHSVEIEVLETQPDRTLVKNEPTDTSKYDGTWFQPCQVMVVGDVVR